MSKLAAFLDTIFGANNPEPTKEEPMSDARHEATAASVATLVKKTNRAYKPMFAAKRAGTQWEPPMTKALAETIKMYEAYKETGMASHAARSLFDIQCLRAESAGFKRFTVPELFQFFTGCRLKDHLRQGRQLHYYYYNYVMDAVSKETQLYDVRELIGENCPTMYMAPASYLKQPIPYGVLLLMKETQEQKLFSCYDAIAPQELWEKFEVQRLDPILFGTIRELGGERTAHYFLAKWI